MIKNRLFLILALTILTLLLLVIVELLIIKYNGTLVPAPTIPREAQAFGSGPKLSYVVMGDSTSVGQGTDYAHSYAVASAKHLAQTHRVKFVNVGVSGAKAKDVLNDQLPKAVAYKPDIVLLGVGANDATHFTGGKTIESSIQQVIDGLRQSNRNVRIVVTGSPAMDSVTRFPWPAKQLMGLRTRQVNKVFSRLIKSNDLVFAPIATKTRTAFLADPTLLAADKFHPNDRGYALWIPIINKALDQALLQ